MPKLTNRPPKYSKLKNYAVVYLNGKIHYLGLYGSPESKTAYARFVAEHRPDAVGIVREPGESVSVGELATTFLDHAKATLETPNYTHHRIVVGDFLLKLYGDIPTDNFRLSCLKLIREELIKSRRFCRKTINDYISRIVRVFSWAVEEELVKPEVAAVLKAIKPLPEGYPGTYDNKERMDIADDVIRRTLPFMSPTVRAMVLIQRLTGMRPSEVFNMQVGHIDCTTDTDLWLYRLSNHKTKKKTKQKKVIPLGKPEQELIAPYLINKIAEQAVFSPRTAMEERRALQKENRKSKMTPSQLARAEANASKPLRYREFYNKDSYCQAVKYAIQQANKRLPADEQIPDWTPYQIRHTAATAMELEVGLDEAQALLDHSSADMTKRYAHARLKKLKELARNRTNPFGEVDSTEEEVA